MTATRQEEQCDFMQNQRTPKKIRGVRAGLGSLAMFDQCDFMPEHMLQFRVVECL